MHNYYFIHLKIVLTFLGPKQALDWSERPKAGREASCRIGVEHTEQSLNVFRVNLLFLLLIFFKSDKLFYVKVQYGRMSHL